jgi:hypothetical protein
MKVCSAFVFVCPGLLRSCCGPGRKQERGAFMQDFVTALDHLNDRSDFGFGGSHVYPNQKQIEDAACDVLYEEGFIPSFYPDDDWDPFLDPTPILFQVSDLVLSSDTPFLSGPPCCSCGFDAPRTCSICLARFCSFHSSLVEGDVYCEECHPGRWQAQEEVCS